MKTILVATDFGKSSQSAVYYAAQLAQDSGARLILLHATHIPVVSDGFFDAGITLDELQKSDKEQMEELNEAIRRKFGPGLKLEKRVNIGFTVELIRDMVDKGSIDLVVMGISHSDALSKALFGSTSTALAGTLRCPVLIIPEKAKYRPLSKIAFTFDQQRIPVETGLKTIKELTKLFNSKVHYVHVMDSMMMEKDSTSLSPVFKLFGDKTPSIHYLKSIPGKTAEIINDWVRRYKANAVVLVSRNHTIFWKMFNERTTKKLAFEVKVPLLVLSESKKD